LQAVKKLADEVGPARLLVLQYHVHDRWATYETQKLYDLYKVTGTPSFFFNGGSMVPGGGVDTSYLYARYRPIIDKELATTATAAIVADRPYDSISGPVEVKIKNTSDQPISGARLFGVAYQDYNTDRHRFLVSDISEMPLSDLAPGETIQVQLSLDTQAYGLSIVVFLKSASGQILQATLLPGASHIWMP
jgi:hypothetical protein